MRIKRLFVACVLCLGACVSVQAADTWDVRAASYNIRCETTESNAQNQWSNRRTALVTLVKSMAPHIIGFQEVRSGQYNYLKEQLPGYTFYGRFRDNGSNSEACPVAYLKDRFDFLDGGTFWLSATPDVVGSKAWGNGIAASGHPRICTWTLLKDKQTNGFICFACTHLDLNAGPRLAGMNLILSPEYIGRFLSRGIPVVIVGDMNECEDSSAMVAATSVMNDSFFASETRPTGSWRTFNGFSWQDPAREIAATDAVLTYRTAAERTAVSESIGKRIDFLFTSRDIRTRTFATRNDARDGVSYYPSDHYPVVADLTLPVKTAWGGKVRVEIGKDAHLPRVAHGRYVLTEGACLANAENLEFILPDWVERATVEDGEIVIYTKLDAFFLLIR